MLFAIEGPLSNLFSLPQPKLEFFRELAEEDYVFGTHRDDIEDEDVFQDWTVKRLKVKIKRRYLAE